MDAFVLRKNDQQNEVKQEAELHVKSSPTTVEPPLKKIKHDAVVVSADDNGRDEDEGPVSNANISKDADTSFESVSSLTQSDGSPEPRVVENCSAEKEKTSSPKAKRRKLSIKEAEERRKVKEEAKLMREQKRQEKLKREQEKEEMKMKKEKEKQAKKEQFEREKQAKKEQLEKERQAKREQLERERTEKQIRKEKLEKERLEKQKKKEEINIAKEEERKKKEEERKQKEEEKKLKEEERRKKEEEKRMKEEEEQRKKDRAKESFKSFFIKKSPPKKAVIVDEKCQLFAPFEVKPNMKMAPVVRRSPLHDYALFSEEIEKQESSELYLSELQKKKSKERIKYVTGRILRAKETLNSSCKTEAVDDIVLLDSEKETEKENNNMHVKLLQFSENYRPPYYGTWRKSSKFISPRNPFKKDENLLNYDMDSDEEWEEEEPGESLSGPENEDEDEEDDENDEENDGFFVPHGYLSDDEGVLDSDGEKQEEKVDIRDKKLDKIEGFPFDEKQKFKQLRATCFGPSWFDSTRRVPDSLAIYSIIPLSVYPIDIFAVKNRVNRDISREESPKNLTAFRSGYHTPLKVPEEAMPLLVNFVHKNHLGLNKLVLKFLAMWNKDKSDTSSHDTLTHAKISKRQLERKILEIAKRDSIGENGKTCYSVHPHILENYKNELDLINNRLSYAENGHDISMGNASNIHNNKSLPDDNKMLIDSSMCGKENSPSDAVEKTGATGVSLDGNTASLQMIDSSSQETHKSTKSQKEEINTNKIQITI